MGLFGHPKMLILAYRDPEFTRMVDRFHVPLNPESYEFNYQVDYANDQPPGTSGQELRFERIRPQRLQFEFLFDRTGAIRESPPIMADGVQADIDKLKKAVLEFDGDIHRTRYLMLTWGKLLFKCCLVNMQVQYKLFRSDGAPLRAIARCTFEEFRETDQRLADENRNSPDLTHYRIVRAGDTLPAMCQRIYGSPDYYLQVAAANDLTHFRNLEPGRELLFPPLENK